LEKKQKDKELKSMEHMKQMQRYQSQKLISRRTFGTQQQIRVQEKIKQ